MIEFIKRTMNVLAYLALSLVAVAWLERGLKWFIKTYDPVFQSILQAKGTNERSKTGETVFAVMNGSTQETITNL